MSYSGPLIYIGNRPIEDVIKELCDYHEAYRGKEVYIGTRVCVDECTYDDECTCNTYSLEIKDKQFVYEDGCDNIW